MVKAGVELETVHWQCCLSQINLVSPEQVMRAYVHRYLASEATVVR